MSSIILVTGASSGFGQMIARDLARAGHSAAGARPLRVHVDPASDGAAVSFAVIDRVREEFLHRIGHADLLHPARTAAT